MTAAHCHSRIVKRRQIAKVSENGESSRYVDQVRLGEWRVDKPDCIGARNEFCLPPVQEFDITPNLVSIHPNYEKTLSGVVNDIALVRLPRPAVVDGVGVQVKTYPTIQPFLNLSKRVTLQCSSRLYACPLRVPQLQLSLDSVT